MIKVKNVDDKSSLHKVRLPLEFDCTAVTVSAGYNASVIVPVNCTLEKMVIAPLIDMTGTSGFLVTLTNVNRGSASISVSVGTATLLGATPDWSAARALTFTPSSDSAFSAGSFISVTISGTIAQSIVAGYLQLDINDKLEK
jgi:hypothetical protein